MQIILNGAAQAAPETLTALLVQMRLEGQRFAVELNGEIVPRSLHTQTSLKDGDTIEIVQAIGGG